ncbi:MAG: hypothetical protein MZV65_46855 [Chromatiales bacterium]|nr:hypothetical protein [Chromatiales bacterium]
MVREWGRIGQPGTVRETWFETEGEAMGGGRAVAPAEGEARVIEPWADSARRGARGRMRREHP